MSTSKSTKSATTSKSNPPAIGKTDMSGDGSPLAPAVPVASLFVNGADFKAPEGAIVKSMSPMLKPANFPVGQVLVGVFKKFFKTSPGKDDKGADKVGTGVEIIPPGAPVGVALPLVATLRTGLEVTGEGETATSPHLGCMVAIKLMPEKIPSKKGNAAWNFVAIIYPKDYKALTA